MDGIAGSPIVTVVLLVLGAVLVGYFGYKAIQDRKNKKK